MHEIICPHCQKAFKIDEAGYADILKQVHNTEFDKQLHERLELAAREKQGAIELAQIKGASDLQKSCSNKRRGDLRTKSATAWQRGRKETCRG